MARNVRYELRKFILNDEDLPRLRLAIDLGIFADQSVRLSLGNGRLNLRQRRNVDAALAAVLEREAKGAAKRASAQRARLQGGMPVGGSPMRPWPGTPELHLASPPTVEAVLAAISWAGESVPPTAKD
jgi:hypothetical protein